MNETESFVHIGLHFTETKVSFQTNAKVWGRSNNFEITKMQRVDKTANFKRFLDRSILHSLTQMQYIDDYADT